MSANDRIILDKILEQRQQELAPQLTPSKFFEIFTSEQILKDYDLSYDEIESGIVGDGGDGGVDSLYVFLNGDLAQDDTDISGLRRNVSIELVIIQAKTSASFSESVIDKLKAFTEDLLDLSKDVASLTAVYNEDVLALIRRFRTKYQDLASRFPVLTVSYRYASRGDDPHPNVVRKVEGLKATVQQLFSSAKSDFQFLGSSALLDLARRAPKTSYSLKLAENPISSSGAVAFVCLVTLRDFFEFITDDKNVLLRSIFESNVRDYQGVTQVNDDIQTTLKTNKDGDEFWWLNNGVTVICSRATLSGKTLTIEDPQIVNGLQTSTEVFNYFRDHNTADEKRNLLVRVIVPPATESRDRIIKATNSQTQIPVASLRATERIHRDIEEFLRPHGLFYDRRKNFYKNEGKAIHNIISIPHLAQSVMSIALQRPNDARARPSSLLKRDAEYSMVFSDQSPISLYLSCANLMKLVDSKLRGNSCMNREDQANLRFYVAMYMACLLTSKANPTVQEIAAISTASATQELFDDAVNSVRTEYQALGASDQTAKGTDLIAKIKEQLRGRYPAQVGKLFT